MMSQASAGEPAPEPTTPVLSSRRHDASEAVTWGVRVAAAWIWRLLLIGVGIYVFTRIFFRVEMVAFSFVVALFLTSVLHPLEAKLRSLIPRVRSVPAVITLLVGVACLVGIGWFVGWQISTHSTELADQVSRVVRHGRDWLHNGPLHLKSAEIDNLANSITTGIKNNEGTVISGAVKTVRTAADALGGLLLVVISTFFLLRDGAGIWRWLLKLFPSAAQPNVDRAGRVGWHVLGGYVRGQVLIALFHGTSVMVVLFVLRVPLAAALGVLIFLGSFIPLIGLTLTGALCVAVAFLEHGLTAALVVAIAIIILVQLESHLLQPVIMSRTVQVHPLAIVVAVLTGATLSGIVGALLAVPLVAFLNATIHALRQTPATPQGDTGFPVESTTPTGRTVDPVSEEVAEEVAGEQRGAAGRDDGVPSDAASAAEPDGTDRPTRGAGQVPSGRRAPRK